MGSLSTARPLVCTASLEGHADIAWGVAWNPRESLLATCSSDREVRLYTYATLPSGVDDSSQTVFSLREVIPTGHKRTVRQVAWSPSGSMLAMASFDCSVGIWERLPDAATGPDAANEPEWDCSGTLEGHDSECKDVAFSHDGSLLASCSRDKSVWIWEVQPDSEFECLSVLMEHSQDVKTVAWHPHEEARRGRGPADSQLLASASYDDTIKLYVDDPSEDWFCYSTLRGHTSTVWSLSFSPCGTYLASASDDLTIRIWRRFSEEECRANGLATEAKVPGRAADRWTEVHRIEGYYNRSIYSLSWARGNANDSAQRYGKLAGAGADGKILVYHVGESHTPFRLAVTLAAAAENAHDVADVNCLAWAPSADDKEATLLASAGDDGIVRIWRAAP
ncbi:Cytosolic iron-sulfur protein assembly protein [Malassezia sp. CBS 17886]|nr:Cytosolic iron-sulfur protein assembly protein [Malassezia sp. CBS 17886]